MAALFAGRSSSPESTPRRGMLLRLADALAERQMRHSYCVISRSSRSRIFGRAQRDNATMIGVNQPSSTMARSSTSACER